MNQTDKIDRRLKEVDRSIEALKRERSQLLTLRASHRIHEGMRDEESLGGRSLEKTRTLAQARFILSSEPDPIPTAVLLRRMTTEFADARNETTLRSHLRRLRIEKKLKYDEIRKVWSLPA